jgi:hypothetical protein
MISEESYNCRLYFAGWVSEADRVIPNGSNFLGGKLSLQWFAGPNDTCIDGVTTVVVFSFERYAVISKLLVKSIGMEMFKKASGDIEG